jgi:RNA polymerase sigma-70 factor (ECF subfamily)
MASHVRAVPTPSSEGSLVTREAASSFEDFFDAERARLFGALSVMTGNRHEVEEIMQDAFLRIWERWERVSAMDGPWGSSTAPR